MEAAIDEWPRPYDQLDARPYWAALNEDRLTYQRCGWCGQSVWPAKSRCPYCASGELDWTESSGRGTVYSYSTVMRGATPRWASIAPYVVGFVEMDEGYLLFTQFSVAEEELSIGDAVEVDYIQRGAQRLPVFAPATVKREV
ncbi:Zn-ribbon domain-containing OB-fold protein [Brevibacterium sp. VCM10]|uniref:Zn-ribbon domain-containing OB-fold protein n=1 Tax=Brevibacterium sp. VCM10 TaxID=1381751 RepID=UPI00046FA48F|nr:OB-fold domain-containing protein [Brevibacterium sp. VCM10]